MRLAPSREEHYLEHVRRGLAEQARHAAEAARKRAQAESQTRPRPLPSPSPSETLHAEAEALLCEAGNLGGFKRDLWLLNLAALLPKVNRADLWARFEALGGTRFD